MKGLPLALSILAVALWVVTVFLWLGPGVRYVTSDGAEVTVRRDTTTVVYPQGKGPLSAITVDGTEKRILVTVEGCAGLER